MKITRQVPTYQQTQTQPKENTKNNSPATANKQQQIDQYIPSKEEKNITYKKPTTKVDTATIDKLKLESERAHEQLRNLVDQLLKKQGFTFQDIKSGNLEVKVDEETRLAAQAAIDEGGPSSPEAVSDRIVDFAKAISSGDQSKFELLKGAIEDGFAAAKNALGGKLPEISGKTYDLVMEKLNNWKNEE